MVQSAVRQAGHVKSTSQVAAASTHVRRGKHSRARSDPIQYQGETSASGSLGCVDGDSASGVKRARFRTVTGDPHSSHQPQTQTTKRTTSSSAKTAVRESAKTDIRKNLTPESSVDYRKKATVLLDWIIKPLPDIRGVCVEGQKLGMADYWHSAAIVEAVRPDIVVTATGSVYRLQGKINKYCTVDNGFPKDVAKAFTKGFPHNWSDVIQEFYRQLEDSISIVAEISPLKRQRLQLQPPCRKLVKTVRKRKTPAVSSQKLQAPDTVPDSIWTPAGLLKQKLSTDDVTVTRSGRISLPPLARWTGQCYRRIPNSSDIEVTFETDCAKKTLHNTTAQLLQLPKSSRKMIYNSSLSKSFQLPADSITNVIDRKLNQTVDVLTNIGECWPVVTAGGSRKKALVAGRKISMKVNGLPSSADQGTRQGISQTAKKSADRVTAAAYIHAKKSADRVAAAADIPVQPTSNKKSTERVSAAADIPALSTSKKKSTERVSAAADIPVQSTSKKKSTERVSAAADIPVQSTSKKKSTERVSAAADIPAQSTSKKKSIERVAAAVVIPVQSTSKKKSTERVAAAADIPAQSTSNKKSTERVAAAADIHVQSTSNKNNRSHNLTNSEQPPAETGPGDLLGTVEESGRHARGVLTRGSTDAHTETSLDKRLRVILSRDVSGDVNTQCQKLTQQPTRPLSAEHGGGPVRRSGRGVHKYGSTSSSNVDSDSTVLQSAESTGTGLNNKSYSKRLRAPQTNQHLQADSSDSRSRESTYTGSSEMHKSQKKTVAKTRSKKTENKTPPADRCSVKSDRKSDSRPLSDCKSDSRPLSDRKSDSRPLSESGRRGLQTEVEPTATVKASGAAKSSQLTTSCQAAAGKRKAVSTTGKRKRDADDDDVKDGTEGNHTIIERKPRKRRKVMDVTASGDVSWSQQEKDLLHRALKEVSGADSSYWQKVSATVATRSEAECQQFYRHSLEGKANQKPRKASSKKPSKASSTSQKHQDKTGRKKGDPIRGGKGTLKRKQDLREFLQEQNEGYEDDLFEGTPFVNRHKQSSLFAVNVDKNDWEIFGVNHNCITPVAGMSTVSTPGTFLRAKMVSVRKTPPSDHVAVLDDTPVTFNRRKADQYIKSFIDRQKKAEPAPAVVQKEQSVLDVSNLPVRSLFSPATDPSILIDSHSTAHQDQEEEDNSPYMYYWNDDS